MAKAPNKDLPVRATMCGTCPFKEGSKTEFLQDYLADRSLNEASHICHSTGANNAFHARTGLPEHLCRGARDLQLKAFHLMGVIAAPTDEAWNNKREEMGLPRQVIADPVRKPRKPRKENLFAFEAGGRMRSK